MSSTNVGCSRSVSSTEILAATVPKEPKVVMTLEIEQLKKGFLTGLNCLSFSFRNDDGPLSNGLLQGLHNASTRLTFESGLPSHETLNLDSPTCVTSTSRRGKKEYEERESVWACGFIEVASGSFKASVWG